MEPELTERTRRSSWRDWARSYILAGRIAAGIFDRDVERRLPESSALVRDQASLRADAASAERIGKIILTLPLDSAPAAPQLDRAASGRVRENPFDLPRLRGRG